MPTELGDYYPSSHFSSRIDLKPNRNYITDIHSNFININNFPVDFHDTVGKITLEILDTSNCGILYMNIEIKLSIICTLIISYYMASSPI